MRPITASVFAIWLLACSPANAGDAIVIEITFSASPSAEEVQLQNGRQSINIALSPDIDRRKFVGTIEASLVGADISNPLDLVIVWPDPNEVIFLNIGPRSPSLVQLRIDPKDRPSEYRPADLQRIDSLGTDRQSLLEKYQRARRFHRHWRKNGLDDHVSALRSARIWFDASMRLAVEHPHIFAPDREILEIVEDYQKLAATNAGLKARISKYFPSALVRNTYQEAVAARYEFVGSIPRLIHQGRLDDAEEYNRLALRSLESSTPEERAAITEKQGINLTLLENNAIYIGALLERQQTEHGDPAGIY